MNLVQYFCKCLVCPSTLWRGGFSSSNSLSLSFCYSTKNSSIGLVYKTFDKLIITFLISSFLLKTIPFLLPSLFIFILFFSVITLCVFWFFVFTPIYSTVLFGKTVEVGFSGRTYSLTMITYSFLELSYSVWYSTVRFLATTSWIKYRNFLQWLTALSYTLFQKVLSFFCHPFFWCFI